MSSIEWSKLGTSNFIVEATYEGKRSEPLNLSCEPLTRLIPGIGNLGGFRVKPKANKDLAGLVLTSTGLEVDWPDSLDIFQGRYTYYGDNRKPGNDLHQTPKGGNKYLAQLFELAHGETDDRMRCPVILIFQSSGFGHDMIFRGLAVPGANNLGAREDLVAEWAAKGGKRFQNYKAAFTILDTGEIDGTWIRDIFSLKPLDLADARVPKPLKEWIQTGRIRALKADPKTISRTVLEQMPSPGVENELITGILNFCKKDPFLFEGLARDIWEMSVSGDMEIGLTRKSRDGGRDALGKLILGPGTDPLKINFVLEAKCYDFKQKVTVRDMSRLVSRIKHREFGVMVTTSAVHSQAYKEIRTDNHPIIIIAGKDIAEILIRKGISSKDSLAKWMMSVDQDRPF